MCRLNDGGALMTLTIELSASAERMLESAAKRRGIAPADYARLLLERSLPPVADIEPLEVDNDPTLKLLEQWAEEERTDDPEEIARREREFEAFKKAMNQNRLDSDGPNARIPYP
jgi:hypothetical protein